MSYEIRIKVDSRQAADKIKKFSREAGASFDKITRKVNKTTRATGRYRQANTGLIRTLGALRNRLLVIGFAITGSIAILNKFVGAASDMQEALNLVEVTFGTAADEIKKFANTAIDSMGISRGEALKLTGGIGSLAQSFGFTAEKVALFSKAVVLLSADIGSLKNERTEDVFIAIRAAVIGSSEPMLRFGADTREAALQQFALKLGLINTIRQLNSQQKALAAIGIIAESQSDAIGDLAKTSNQFAGAVKLFNAQAKQFAEEFGSIFLDFATKSVIAFRIILRELPAFVEELEGLNSGTKQELKKGGFEEIFKSWFSVEKLLFPGKVGEQFVKDAGEFGDKVQEALLFGVAKTSPTVRFLLFVSELGEKVRKEFAKQVKKESPLPSILDELLKPEGRAFTIRSNFFNPLKNQLNTVSGLVLKSGDLIRKLGSEGEFAKFLELQSQAGLFFEREELRQKQFVELNVLKAQTEETKKQKRETVALNAVAGRFNQNLISAVLHGQDLGQALKSAAISFALSFLPGGRFFRVAGSFAHGTSFAPGGLALVGERGPEIVNLPRGSQVIPNNEINNINNTSTVNIILPNVTNVDKFTLRNEIMPLMNEIVNEGGQLTASITK